MSRYFRTVRSCHYGTHRTDEQKKKMSERMAGSGNPYFGCKHTKEECEKSRIANLGNKNHKDKRHSEETRESISRNCKESFSRLNREDTHRNQHSGQYKLKHYQGRMELSFLKHIEEFGLLPETVRCFPVKYKKRDGTEHTYLPDFFIPSLDLIVEIKSDCYFERDRELNLAKWKSASKHHKFMVIINNDFTELDKIVKGENK